MRTGAPKPASSWQRAPRPTTCAQRLQYITSCVHTLTSEPSETEEPRPSLRSTAEPLAVDRPLSSQSVSTDAEARACPVLRSCLVCSAAATGAVVINAFTIRSLGHLCDRCQAF